MTISIVIRTEGPAPKGQESLAQGLPWVSRNKRFAPKGLGKRSVPALPPSEVNEARLTEEAKRGRFAYLPGGPFRANSDFGTTQGKPWAMFSWPLRATEYNQF